MASALCEWPVSLTARACHLVQEYQTAWQILLSTQPPLYRSHISGFWCRVCAVTDSDAVCARLWLLRGGCGVCWWASVGVACAGTTTCMWTVPFLGPLPTTRYAPYSAATKPPSRCGLCFKHLRVTFTHGHLRPLPMPACCVVHHSRAPAPC